MTQRDTFIAELFEIAKKDKDVYLISVDMGAPALDRWRSDLPDQFMSAGISEQHAINFAAGLAAEGKKPYVYFMASWAARCFEQIRYSCCMAEHPITVLGNGVALGYAPAGPAHETNDDMAYMRSLLGIEIYSPTNNEMTKSLVHLTYNKPKVRYIRLERKYAEEFEGCYNLSNASTNFVEAGMYPVKPGLSDNPQSTMPKVALLSYGYMLGRGGKVWDKFIEDGGVEITLYDLWKIKPLDSELIARNLSGYDYVVTLEEQTLSGGFGSAVCEALADENVQKPILRIGLPERYIFENGSRDYHLDNNGLSVDDIHSKIKDFIS